MRYGFSSPKMAATAAAVLALAGGAATAAARPQRHAGQTPAGQPAPAAHHSHVGIRGSVTVLGASRAYVGTQRGPAPAALCPAGTIVTGTGFNGPFNKQGGSAIDTGHSVVGVFGVTPVGFSNAPIGNDTPVSFDNPASSGNVEAICARVQTPSLDGIYGVVTVLGADRTYLPGESGPAPAAQCPPGKEVTGAGFSGPFGHTAGSALNEGTYVDGSFGNDSSTPVTGHVQAICAQRKSSTHDGLTGVLTVDGAAHSYVPGEIGPTAVAQCPPGTVVVGTGFSGPSNGEGGSFVQAYGTYVGGYFSSVRNNPAASVYGHVQATCALVPRGTPTGLNLINAQRSAKPPTFASDVLRSSARQRRRR